MWRADRDVWSPAGPHAVPARWAPATAARPASVHRAARHPAGDTPQRHRATATEGIGAMLSAIQALPTDGPVASIHVVAFVDRQHVVMAWDQNERYLTTV